MSERIWFGAKLERTWNLGWSTRILIFALRSAYVRINFPGSFFARRFRARLLSHSSSEQSQSDEQDEQVEHESSVSVNRNIRPLNWVKKIRFIQMCHRYQLIGDNKNNKILDYNNYEYIDSSTSETIRLIDWGAGLKSRNNSSDRHPIKGSGGLFAEIKAPLKCLPFRSSTLQRCTCASNKSQNKKRNRSHLRHYSPKSFR